MQLETVHFGLIDINENDILDFPEGLPGFEEVKKFILLGKDSEDNPFFWLQSVDKPNICFVVTDPFMLYNDYAVDIDDEEAEILDLNGIEALVLSIVVIPENILEARVNLRAPVIINTVKRIGKQVLQRNDELPLRFYLNNIK